LLETAQLVCSCERNGTAGDDWAKAEPDARSFVRLHFHGQGEKGLVCKRPTVHRRLELANALVSYVLASLRLNFMG
jgi:hypothetical protein